MKRWLVIFFSVLLCVQLCGCDFWLEDTYVSVKPYLVQDANAENEVVTADSYIGVREALEELVEDCIQSAIIAVPTLDEKFIDYYMAAAINYITGNNAIGAYAVNEISYEIGTNAGELAVAVDITYNYNRIEILRIKRADGTEGAVAEIKKALQQCDADITLYISNYADIDFIQMVQDYVDENPQYCMEMPQVTAAVYPNKGHERVLVLTFTYRNSRDVLRSMQSNVQEVFSQLKVEGKTPGEKYAELYSFLMDRQIYTVETSITPAYSLLRYGVGDSKAFANVYAAMCRKLELDCQVVSGTKGGEAWYWNVIMDDDTAYYIDLLRCSQEGSFNMLDESQMSGYVWDYSAYPTQEPVTE